MRAACAATSPAPSWRSATAPSAAPRSTARCGSRTSNARRMASQRFKLPATVVLGDLVADVPEVPLGPMSDVDYPTWRAIRYEERGAVGFLHFPFYNGAMSTVQCAALRAAYVAARERPTRVIVLMGGPDFWSNGIHLNQIEASAHPAEESWRNINAMDDLVREVLLTDRQLTIAALQGNAGRRRRVPGTGRGSGSRPRRRHPQPALQGDGQPLRLRILDLRPPAPCCRGDRRRRSPKIGCRSGSGRPRSSGSSMPISAPIRRPFVAENRGPGGGAGARRRLRSACWRRSAPAGRPMRLQSRSSATGPRSSTA